MPPTSTSSPARLGACPLRLLPSTVLLALVVALLLTLVAVLSCRLLLLLTCLEIARLLHQLGWSAPGRLSRCGWCRLEERGNKFLGIGVEGGRRLFVLCAVTSFGWHYFWLGWLYLGSVNAQSDPYWAEWISYGRIDVDKGTAFQCIVLDRERLYVEKAKNDYDCVWEG